MNLTLQIAKGPREKLAWLFCFIGLPFALGQLFIDMRYNTYREEYHITQQEETRAANAKIAETYSLIKNLAHNTGQFIRAAGEDLPAIQKSLHAATFHSSQHPNPPAFLPQSLMYYKLTGQKAIITPAWIAPLATLPVEGDKPPESIPSFAFHNNELIGTFPVTAKDNQLAGILELGVPSIALQKFVGADRLTTLNFPPLFDKEGRALLQKDPLAFSLISPLSRTDYFLSHEDYFWVLVYAVVIGVGFLFLFQRIFKQRASLAFGAHIGQLTEEWESRRSSLEARNSFQGHLLGRFKEATHIVHRILTHLGTSEECNSLTAHHTDTLMQGATALSGTLSQGVTNYRRDHLSVLGLLTQVKTQMAYKLRELKVTWDMTCPEDLTLCGDELFVKQILLNALGYPLYYMPKGGKVSITVTQQDGFVCVEAQDNRFVLTPSAKARLILPEDFIEEDTLRQICAQHHIEYEFSQIPGGVTQTKIVFPENFNKANLLSWEPSPATTLH